MTDDAAYNGRKQKNGWPEIERLYCKVVDALYGPKRGRMLLRLCDRLDRLLAKEDPKQQAILGQECRALVSEARGDLAGAIAHRILEIRLRKRWLESIHEPPTQVEKSLLKSDGPADLADRYDLLAILFHDAGHLKNAIDALWQSRELCELHGIKFDGKDLLRDYLVEYQSKAPGQKKVASRRH